MNKCNALLITNFLNTIAKCEPSKTTKRKTIHFHFCNVKFTSKNKFEYKCGHDSFDVMNVCTNFVSFIFIHFFFFAIGAYNFYVIVSIISFIKNWIENNFFWWWNYFDHFLLMDFLSLCSGYFLAVKMKVQICYWVNNKLFKMTNFLWF